MLCTIYDLSYLTMTLSVDELDIASIEVGQSVSIVADAVEDTTYTGTVTKVSVAGTSSGSATTYPVTIRIDETDGLLPGMSVDATIELASAEDVLAIPSAALNRGDTVLVTADSPSAANGTLVESTTEDGEDYYSVEVTTGVSGDDYIEIVLRPAGGGHSGLYSHQLLQQRDGHDDGRNARRHGRRHAQRRRRHGRRPRLLRRYSHEHTH